MENISKESLIDTNILIYANNKDSPYHEPSKGLVENALNGDIEAALSTQNLVEFYAIITDKKRLEHPLSPKRAKELVEFYCENKFLKVISPLPETITTLADLIEKHEPIGQAIFDFLLVATMKDHAISQIYTSNDRHFRIFDFLKIINPLS